MNRLHTKLIDRYPWYAKWHRVADISLIHFVILMALVSATTLLLQTPLQEYGNQQLAAAGTAARSNYAQGKLLVQFRTGVKAEDETALLRGQGAQKIGELPEIRVHIISVPAGAEEKVRLALSKNPRVQFVEPDYLAQSTVVPNDPNYVNQWFASVIGEPAGWDMTTGAASVVVAVLDAPVHINPDFQANLVPGYNTITDSSDATPNSCLHGTSVAGVIGSIGNNGVGTAGVSWGSKIMPIVIGDASCYGLYSNMAQGIIYAVDHGARVINLSYSGTNPSATLESAVNYARSKGALFFASSGNSSTNVAAYPAGYEQAISVGATGSTDVRASWSNYGPTLDIVAPGVSIYTSTSATGYGAKSGTSFAAPMAAGLAALVWSVNPALTNVQVWDVIRENAVDLGTAGRDDQYGWGRINVSKTLAAAKLLTPTTDTLKPTVTLTAPSTGTTVSGQVSVTASASDNAGVTKVEFFKDARLVATDTASPYGFYWDTTLDTATTHTLEARAYDGAGNTGTSGVRSVTVTAPLDVGSTTDTVAPKITITSPANGTKIKGKGAVNISTTAVDPSGITSIVISADGKVLTTCTAVQNCSASWPGKAIVTGTHTISVVATDASTARNTASASVTITK